MYAPGFGWRPGSPPLLRGRRGTMCAAKGSDVRPGVPLASWVSATFAWQAWNNVRCQGVGCTPRGSAGVLGLRHFCVAGVEQCALPRGRMYAPGFRWRPWVSAAFAWQVWIMRTAKGSDVRPGVPWDSVAFAWQAWDNVHCQRSDVRPGVPWGSASFAWQAWDNIPKGLIYALSSLGAPPLLRGRRGTILPKGLIYALSSRGAPPLLRGRRGTIHVLTHSLTITHSLTHAGWMGC